MRERLSKMIDEAIRYADKHYPDSPPIVNGTYTRLMAEYLLSNGVIVPPVKVGDKLYGFRERIVEYTVTELRVLGNTIEIYGEDYYFHRIVAICADKDIGKGEIYRTRAEAEKALAELNKEGEG